jgi:phosphoribosylglycinamide formyltransferase-1
LAKNIRKVAIMKICFLASGNGGHFKFLYLLSKLNIINNVQFYVIADRKCGSIKFAKNNKVYNKIINYSRKNNIELLNELEKINPDVVITNWHKIIDEQIIKLYSGKIINLHYSLLPAFGGLIGIKPIQKAFEQNCQYIGATCHYVDEGVDTGKIISQYILKKDDIKIIEAIQKIFEGANLILLNTLIKEFKIGLNTERIKNNKYEYAPSLEFDDSLFDDNFWNRLKQL